MKFIGFFLLGMAVSLNAVAVTLDDCSSIPAFTAANANCKVQAFIDSGGDSGSDRTDTNTTIDETDFVLNFEVHANDDLVTLLQGVTRTVLGTEFIPVNTANNAGSSTSSAGIGGITLVDTVSGNVMSNDSATAVTTDVFNNDLEIKATATLLSSNIGTFGILMLDSEGTYNYFLNTDFAATQDIGHLEVANDQFSYQLTDIFTGITDTGTLTIRIIGNSNQESVHFSPLLAPIFDPATSRLTIPEIRTISGRSRYSGVLELNPDTGAFDIVNVETVEE